MSVFILWHGNNSMQLLPAEKIYLTRETSFMMKFLKSHTIPSSDLELVESIFVFLWAYHVEF